MDKLIKHGIRMLEIVEGEHDFFRNDEQRQADIAQAVYDTIVRVLRLERKIDCKTKPMEVSYTKEISTTAKGYSKTVTEPQTERSE